MMYYLLQGTLPGTTYSKRGFWLYSCRYPGTNVNIACFGHTRVGPGTKPGFHALW